MVLHISVVIEHSYYQRFTTTVFLPRIQHLLFFGTLSLKCVLNLHISASALVLRHGKPKQPDVKSPVLNRKEL